MVPPQSVVADAIGAGVMVRNDDPGVVAALSADDLATGERIDPTEAGAVSQGAVNPTGLQCCVIRGSQIRPNRARKAGSGAANNVFCPNKRLRDGRIFVFCLPVEVVYTTVERIQISPPKGNGSRANAGHCLFGAMGCDALTAAPERTERRWSSSHR